jgi:transcriptional regulator with XRE-family HTH domain
MRVNERISSVMRAKMKEKGITQEKLAELTGISQPNISRLLAGRSPQMPKSIRSVLDALGLELTAEDK